MWKTSVPQIWWQAYNGSNMMFVIFEKQFCMDNNYDCLYFSPILDWQFCTIKINI